MNHFPLADDHTEIDALLNKVFAALDKENVETIYKSLDFFWARLAMHIRADHLHLFPAITNAIETPRLKITVRFRFSTKHKRR